MAGVGSWDLVPEQKSDESFIEVKPAEAKDPRDTVTRSSNFTKLKARPTPAPPTPPPVQGNFGLLAGVAAAAVKFAVVAAVGPLAPARYTDQKERKRRAAAQDEARRVEKAFDKSTAFEFETMIAHGVTGVSCRVRTKAQRGTGSRFVVKRAFGGGERYIRAENRILSRLRGAAHILQLFPIDPKLDFPSDQVDANTIITEYVENGSLYNFFLRIDRPLPNRVLLLLFQCFVKFCIAMAFPPEANPGSVAVSEEIPTDPVKRGMKFQLRHNDMHMNNILIGDLAVGNPYDVEHALVPTLKLIDFDHAHIVPDPQNNLGVRWNIFDIGENMRALIALDGRLQPPQDVQINRPPRRYSLRTRAADLQPAAYPDTDPDILYLVMWCMAEDPLDRPTLEALDAEVKRLIQERTYAYYLAMGSPNALDEEDDLIMALLEQLIFWP
ncbi:hypothetical protein GGR57DRAFT_157759 [Xylariaceae sp. FL1272]|nr:hypothetical protein GGR57DRAFT_157759 [Xylariaceae sp. FL1272]